MNFVFKLDPDPKFYPKNAFFIFPIGNFARSDIIFDDKHSV